ncbi:DegT/DnrJ/EryC1/StrS family aminotransferase [Zavarzinia sp. CC-PAN008]|uniref:DegT/DnrJ/EryC1/StrS family aminotransferase n=1 Tax=Zavarzinia sp. CC-PAN008 TaxID=3243332 RepID=UPI003F7439B0
MPHNRALLGIAAKGPPLAFVDLKAQYARLKPMIDARIAAVLARGDFIMGTEVGELERALSGRAGVTNAIAVGSGTDALRMALMALGIGAGDAVFVPAFTFTATAEAVLVTGASPVFVDVDPLRMTLSVDDLAIQLKRVAERGHLRPAAVIPVDLFGLPADYAAIRKLADQAGLAVVGDAAQSFGGRLHGVAVGALAPITATSFYPTKPLGCFGDGGALFCDDEGTAAVLRSIREHGRGEVRYDIVRLGINGRLDTIQAAILLAKLTAFDAEIEARAGIADRYDARLTGLVQTPLRPPGLRCSWGYYTIRVAERDAVRQVLDHAGVPTAVYYPRPMHLQPAYRMHGEREGSLPVSEDLCAQVLSLPIHADMTDDDVDRVCDALVRTLRAGA